MCAHPRSRALSSAEDDFGGVLLRLLSHRGKRPRTTVIRQYCREARAFFKLDAVSYWELAAPNEVMLRHSEGNPSFRGGHRSARLNENEFFNRAFSQCRVTVSKPSRRTFNSGKTGFGFQWCLVAPVRPNGCPQGVLVFVRRASLRSADRIIAKQAAKLAAAFEATLAAPVCVPRADAAEVRAQSLMNLAVELKPSLRLPEFVGRFTLRAAEMLGARAAILALTRGSRLETLYSHNAQGQPEWPNLDAALTTFAAEHPQPLVVVPAAELLGTELAFLGWRDLCFVRLTGSQGDFLGAICLIDRARGLSEADRNLLLALVDHASVALENSRLFSRIEQSKRQWVEDFDAITDLIIVHDPANRIVRVNRSLAEALDSRPSELIGTSTRALNSIAQDSTGRPCPFCREPARSTEESVLTSGARAFLISTSRIGGGSEEGSRTIHILKDITEQRTYQTQLQRERDFNTKILNHTQSMIVVLDTAGLVSYANRRCYEAGYREEQLLGQSLAEFIPSSRRALFERSFENALHGFASENLELPVLRGNRSTGRFSISLSPMRDEQGQVNSIVVVMSDITDAAVLQTQLRHSEKMAALGQLVSGVAHEINNPLAAIVGYSDLLLENPDISESAKDELRIVLQEAERTKEIVQNLLHFARQTPARREPLDIHSVLRQVLQLRSYGSTGESIEILEDFASSLPRIFGDAHQLQQMFLNILNNAYDAVHEAQRTGKIEIITSESDGMVEIAIRDNGTGIADTERIFEPFYTTKEVGRGTGLGLSICYGIVREHGGEVSCMNNTDSIGATFFVRLPTAAVAALAGVAEEGAQVAKEE